MQRRQTFGSWFYCTCAILAFTCAALAAEDAKMPAQANRGKALFTGSTKGLACSTCHKIGDVGNEVGPDVMGVAKWVGPRGVNMTIHMTMTAHVATYKTKEGNFPGIEKSKSAEQVEVWDLTENKPVLRTIKTDEVHSVTANEKWQHPPLKATYNAQDLADIIGYLKFLSTGSTVEIAPGEINY